jgi:adenine-specific DNA-methyltransferase
MNYIGSKYSLLPFLEKNILQVAGTQTDRTFFDIFAGTGAVGHHFKKLGFRIVANDIQYYSYCLNRAYVAINSQPDFAGITDDLPRRRPRLFRDGVDTVLDYLNSLEGVAGFVYHNYCPGGTAETEYPRQYFTDRNGMHCDAVRLQIEDWYGREQISESEYFYLLASLIEAIDQVANTASVYGAFLKHFKQSARKRLTLRRLNIASSRKVHQVYNRDAYQLVDQVPCEILYMDPPYNERQYGANYHVLETIARYDAPGLRGVTGLRDYDDQKSDFCYKDKALESLEDLLQRTPARFVFLSYNSEGLMPEDQILTAMRRHGSAKLQALEYSRFLSPSF